MKQKNVVKKAFSFFLAVCLTIGGISPVCRIPKVNAAELTDGLVGYWNFDEDVLTNLAPDSGYTENAELVGSGVTLQKDSGVSGGSLYFSKADSSNLRLPRILNASTESFSIAAWIKYDADTFSSGNIHLFQQAGQGRTILYLKPDLHYGTYLTAADYLCTDATELNTWNHVIVTWDASAHVVQFYLNGKRVNTEKVSGSAFDGTADVLIGSHKNAAADGAIKGNLDELRFYKTVITEDMADAMYREFEAAKKLPELASLIAEAKTLNGSTDPDAIAELASKTADAEALLKNSSPSADDISTMMEALTIAVNNYKASVCVRIAVNTSEELREISDSMYGINHRYHNDAYRSWNSSQQAIEEKFNTLVKEANFGSIRYPGGTVSNLFDWKRSIGPVEQRKRTIHGLPDSNEPISPNFGVDEAMSWIYDELQAQAIWVYGMGQGSASDAADLFEYLNAPNDGSNLNGGIDWAAERAKNGHPEPYGVTNFEIGNEIGYYLQTYWMDGRESGRSVVDCYIDGGTMTFNKNTKTVKEEDWRTSAANSDGSANQERFVKYLPVTAGSASVYVGGTQWNIVDSLDDRGAENVCTFDYNTGKITFGDGTHGNIPAKNSVITAAYQTEQSGFIDYYKELNKAADALGMDIHVYSCIYWDEFAELMNRKGYNEFYDGIVIHPYSDNGIDADDSEFYEKVLGRSLEHNVTRVRNLINVMEENAPGMHKVPVISEFGIYQYNTPFIRSIGHAIYIANEMIYYTNLGTPYLNKHCLVDYPYQQDSLGAGSQCVIQAIKNENGGVDFVSTPSAKLFSIFNNMTGNTQVNQTIEGNNTYYTYNNYNVPTINTLSTKDDEGNTYIIIVNNRKNDYTQVSMTVDDRNLTGLPVDVWYLTSENVDDENTLDAPNQVDIVKTSAAGTNHGITYRLAPHSVTGFKIPAQVSVTTKAEEGGTASDGIKTELNRKVTVNAVPNKGYTFAGWYIENTKISSDTSYTFEAKSSVILTAKFSKINQPETDKPAEPDKPASPEHPIGTGYTCAIGNYTYKVTSDSKQTIQVTALNDKKQKKLVIPNTVTLNNKIYKVTSVAASAFKNNKKLTSIIIGKNVETIGSSAFSGCSGLQKASINSTKLKQIGSKAFYNCKKLKKICLKTKVLKTAKSNCFKGINKNAVIRVPASKYKIYCKRLAKKGQGRSVKIKKL